METWFRFSAAGLSRLSGRRVFDHPAVKARGDHPLGVFQVVNFPSGHFLRGHVEPMILAQVLDHLVEGGSISAVAGRKVALADSDIRTSQSHVASSSSEDLLAAGWSRPT
jgi:hypothetical protein